MFAVESLDDTVARLRGRGAELVGEVAQYEDKYRLCYMRAPAGIILALAEEHDFDGIDIDYEMFSLATKDAFSEFIERLAAGLHAQGVVAGTRVGAADVPELARETTD